MSDWSELKRLAEAASKNGHHIYINARDDNNWRDNAQFHVNCTPAEVLALIAENEESAKHSVILGDLVEKVIAERDQLKAENEALTERLTECAEFIDELQESLDIEGGQS